ncbi:Outer membrane protein IcsA autotransporter precursor [Budvicia aquatica]|uniref:Outer membrane protein IcsA autotransporter n=1 Tax=Budvicia aquatica TaxID=82979 RepID=A0A484ZHD5_9GAMM|nr:Outer membrane protein IcsA autotransporter precursor [Budvicia aquatica]
MKLLTSYERVTLNQSTALLMTVFTLSTIALPQMAHAACTDTGTGTYLCENTNTAGITISGTDIAVQTAPSFSVNESGTTDPALSLIGSGSISFTDIHASPLITSGAYSLKTLNDTSAPGLSTTTLIKTNGTVNNGIWVENRRGAESTILVNITGVLSGGANGNAAIYLAASAEGDSSITLSSGAISANTGIQSHNLSHRGMANTYMTLTDDINVDSTGVSINNSGYNGSSIVNFNSKNIIAESDGLNIHNSNNNGDVLTDIEVDGDIRINAGTGGNLNTFGSHGTSSLKFRANNIIGGNRGLSIENGGDNDTLTDIALMGDITASSGYGMMYNSRSNEADIKTYISLNNVMAMYGGISVDLGNRMGDVLFNLNVSGSIDTEMGYGMNMFNSVYWGDAKTSITLNNVTALSDGLYFNTNAIRGNVLFNLDVSGNIESENSAGLILYSNASNGNSVLSLKVHNIIAYYAGLYINNSGDSGQVVTTVTVTGDITANLDHGVITETTASLGDATAIINVNNARSTVKGVRMDTYANTGLSTTDLTVAGQISGAKGIVLKGSADNGSAIITADVNQVATDNNAVHISSYLFSGDTGLSTIDAITRGAIVSQQGYGIRIETNTAETYLTVAGLVHGGDGSAVGLYRLDDAQKSATLELQPGYVLEGTTQALVNESNYFDPNTATLDLPNSHLVLGGAGQAEFDLTRIDNRDEAITEGDSNRITGFGTLAKTGNSVWTLTGTNTADGPTDSFLSAYVDSGILVLDNATLGLTGSVARLTTTPALAAVETNTLTVADGAALSSIGSSTVIGNVTSAGALLLSNGYAGGNGTVTGDRLTIAGNYAGNGASIVLDTQLGNDSSATDRLVIQGDATGTTSVRVNNAGGTGAQTHAGITIIEVDGVSFDNAFLLKGDYVTTDGKPAVIGGAYAYTLQASGEEAGAGRDWFLSSELTPTAPSIGTIPEKPVIGGALRYQPGAPLYEQYPQILAALNTLPTLQQRVGNRYWSQDGLTELSLEGLDDAQWAWGRIEGNHQNADPAKSTSGSQRDIDLWKLQTGLDIPLYQSQEGSLLTGGVNFSYGKAMADIDSYVGSGSIDSSGYGIGTTLTWYGNDGVYLDGQLQTMWFDSGLSSDTLGQSLVSDNHGRGYASSIETGKRYALGAGCH